MGEDPITFEEINDSMDDRLSFDQVRDLVGALGTPTLRQLADGPMPDVKGDGCHCRVCMVLGRRAAVSPAAAELKRWHEFFDETPGLDAVTKNWRDRETEEDRHEHRKAFGEWKKVAGDLSYARNGMIYAFAQAELAGREEELPDERDHIERRQDEEAEDAERRLDAGKVGDL